MIDELKAQLNNQIEEFIAINEAIGHDYTNQIEELQDNMKEVFSKHISLAKDQENNMIETINARWSKIRAIASSQWTSEQVDEKIQEIEKKLNEKSNVNLPTKIEILDFHCQQYWQQYQLQSKRFEEAYAQIDSLCNELKCTVPEKKIETEDGEILRDVGAEAFSKIQDTERKLIVKKEMRMNEVKTLSTSISTLLNQLGITQSTNNDDKENKYDYAILNNIDIPLTIEAISALKKREVKLLRYKGERQSIVNSNHNRLMSIYKELCMGQASLKEFTDRLNAKSKINGKYSDDVCLLYDKEIEKMKQVRLTKLPELLEKVRKDIRSVWDQLKLTTQERFLFKPMQQSYTECTEEIVDIHQKELKERQDEYQSKKHIFIALDERASIRQTLKPPSTGNKKLSYLNVPRTPLRVKEAELKNNIFELNEMNENIRLSIIKYENDYKKQFMMNGKSLLAEFDQENDKFNVYLSSKQAALKPKFLSPKVLKPSKKINTSKSQTLRKSTSTPRSTCKTSSSSLSSSSRKNKENNLNKSKTMRIPPKTSTMPILNIDDTLNTDDHSIILYHGGREVTCGLSDTNSYLPTLRTPAPIFADDYSITHTQSGLPKSTDVQLWNKVKETWTKLFLHLGVDPVQYNIVIPQSVCSPTSQSSKICELLFEYFNVKGVHIAPSPLLVAYSYGVFTGLIVEMNHDAAYVVPIVDGFMITAGIRRADHLGCDSMNSVLLNLLRESNTSIFSFMPTQAMIKVCDEIRMENGFCVLDYDNALNNNTHIREMDFKSTGSIDKLQITHELFSVSQMLFQPDLFLDAKDLPSLQQLIMDSIHACAIDTRQSLLSCICPSGEGSMLLEFPNKLEKELKLLLPRADSYISVRADPNRKDAVWAGGAILSSLPDFIDHVKPCYEYQEEREFQYKMQTNMMVAEMQEEEA